MSCGIDPTTHRAINESSTQKVTSISFASGNDEKINIKAEFGTIKEDEISSRPVKEECPDLNLELRISPPYQQNYLNDQDLKQSPRCFACSLGIENSKDCNCSKNNMGNIASYDFLGLKTNGVLDYRTLETK